MSPPYYDMTGIYDIINKTFTSSTLYVPKGTKGKDKATPAWNNKEIGLKGDVNKDGSVDVYSLALTNRKGYRVRDYS